MRRLSSLEEGRKWRRKRLCRSKEWASLLVVVVVGLELDCVVVAQVLLLLLRVLLGQGGKRNGQGDLLLKWRGQLVGRLIGLAAQWQTAGAQLSSRKVRLRSEDLGRNGLRKLEEQQVLVVLALSCAQILACDWLAFGELRRGSKLEGEREEREQQWT